MKKRLVAILVMVVMIFVLTGCSYEVEFNWPISFKEKCTPAPTPQPCTCPHCNPR